MIYIKRILWLIGLLPVSVLFAIWLIVELAAIPLRMFVQFLFKGRVDDAEIGWFSVFAKLLTGYFYIDLTKEKE